MVRLASLLSVLIACVALAAELPPVKQLPPAPKAPLSAADRAELEAGVAKLGKEIAALKQILSLRDRKAALLLPDVQIYHNAVRYPLLYNEPIDMKQARQALLDGLDRAAKLRAGQSPWVTAGGPRGYVSKIDGSVQPYLLFVPANFNRSQKHRLDFVAHGRNENLMELVFLNGKPIAAENKIVVALYGRYCCANKLAGEMDLFECLESLRQQYSIDENRILNIGFSMGGGACWHFAVHYADVWAAASPGAGFADAAVFLKNFENDPIKPTWYQRVLHHLYDCPDWAVNLANVPVIAYAGELDPQKAASDLMEKAMAGEGLKLQRIIAPDTKHTYEPKARAELDKRLDEILAKGRNPNPETIRFATWTLRYNRMFWVTVDGLERHWKQARVEAQRSGSGITATTKNVTALTFAFAAGQAPVKAGQSVSITIDGTKLEGPKAAADGSLTARLVKNGSSWKLGALPERELRKRHGLQGPVDDAFMDSFVFVKPTGAARNSKVAAWVKSEMEHAIAQWRGQYRGEPRVKSDSEITEADIASSNLVLFGEPASNKVLGRIAVKLPIAWTAEQIAVGAKKYRSANHALIAVYPNPLNPTRYVVLNSGHTFREYDNLNNARQIPKLPDYAVVNVDTPPNAYVPGDVVEAGFFGETWQLLRDGGRDLFKEPAQP